MQQKPYQPLIATLLLLACTEAPVAPHAPPAADTVILDAAIYTVNPLAPWAEALAIDGGRIVAIGANGDVETRIGPATRVLRLPDAMVLPGLHDAHVHPVWAGLQASQCNLFDLDSVAAILEQIRRCADKPEDGWILGGGYNPALFDKGAPRKDLLDAIAPHLAIYLDDADGHGAWLNSRALTEAGIHADTEVPAGGVIELDDISGEPTGTLREGAVNLVRAVAPKASLDKRITVLRESQRRANAFGITSMIAAQVTEQFLQPIHALAARDELTLNVLASLHYGGEVLGTPTPELVARRAEFQTGRLTTHSAKIFADGVLEGGTAAMLEPYAGFGHRGDFLVQPQTLKEMVQELDGQDVQVHIHAIGDAGVRAALDAVEYALQNNGQRDNRHHIAHAQIIHPDDIPRFAKLNVTANFQALWAYPDAYITELNLPEVGQERVDQMYPLASIEKAGGRIAGSSDWSVSSLNPFLAIETAVTREDAVDVVKGVLNPAERVSLETMLAAYTINTAYLMKQEDRRGSLEVGKAADIAIIDRNLFEIPAQAIGDAQVLYTFLDGELIFRRD